MNWDQDEKKGILPDENQILTNLSNMHRDRILNSIYASPQQPSKKEIINNIYTAIYDRLTNPSKYGIGSNYRFFRDLRNADNILSTERSVLFQEDKFNKEFQETVRQNEEANKLNWYKAKQPTLFNVGEYGSVMYHPEQGVIPMSVPIYKDQDYINLQKQIKGVGKESDQKDQEIEYTKAWIDYLKNTNSPPISYHAFKFMQNKDYTDASIGAVNINGEIKYGWIFRSADPNKQPIFIKFTPQEEEYYKGQIEKNYKK